MGRRDHSDEVAAAVDKYREFHRLDPRHLEEIGELEIPHRVRRLGAARHVLYRSSKVDPDTLKRPKRAVDYIHEFSAGVVFYSSDGRADVDVPAAFREITAMVKLGKCLGFALKDGNEAEGSAPLPDLACSPCGRCLYIIQDKVEVLGLFWGGDLGVWARGIDG